MVRLPRQIAYSKAMEIMLVGDMFDAQEAQRIGLINYSVPADQVMAKAEEFAHKIAANGPLAVRKIKRQFKALSVSLEEGFELENASAREILQPRMQRRSTRLR
jgi:enoyl-CoA hydratase/carnithine racemase